jgi:hypothetical protein
MPENNNTYLSQFKPQDFSGLLAVAPKGATTMYGFKESQYAKDFNVPMYGEMSDKVAALQEARAQEQPFYDKLANSTLKLAAVAGTTFVDIYAGTATGLINMGLKSTELLIDNKEDNWWDATKSVVNAFVNNPTSVALNSFNDWLDSDVLVNYRTKKEMDNEWWQNALSAEGAANFWGENILKNAGFMVGAMSASKLVGAGLSRLVKLEAARTEFKTIQNAATKLGLGEDIAAKNMDEIMNIARNNPAMYGAASESVIKDLGNAAQKVRAKTFQVQAGAATLGAFGEARMEAIGNGNQYRESLLMPLNQKYKQGLITEDEYNEELKKIDKQVEAYQNVSWLSNALLLTGSNYLGWRDSFLKPYDYNAKNIIGKREGSIAKGYNYVAPPIFTTALKRKAVDAFRESQEEQAQFFIDKATGSYINALYNGNDYAQSLGKALSEGFSETYGSAEGWENAFAGALFGAVGVPGVGGGFRSEYKNLKAKTAEEAAAIENLNKFIQEGNLTNNKDSILAKAFYSNIALSGDQNNAVLENDRKAYEDLKHQKFFNLANAFIDAGKYEDFLDLIESEADLDVEEIKKKYSYKNSDGVEVSYFENKDASEIKSTIASTINKVKTEYQNLRDLKDSLSTLYQNTFVKIKDENGKDVEILARDMITQMFYMGKKRDERITDLRAKISDILTRNYKVSSDKNADQVSNVMNLQKLVDDSFTKDFEGGKANRNAIIDEFNKFTNTLDDKLNGVDIKQTRQLFQDYLDLITERAIANINLAQLSKNDFSDLVTAINKRIEEANAAKNQKEMNEFNAELDDEAKLNFVKNKAKEAGYVDKDGNPYFGKFFTMTDSKGTRTFEIDPSNAVEIRKDLIAERDGIIAEMDPKNVDGIKQVTLDYEELIAQAIAANTAGGFIKNLEDNAYIVGKDGKEISFDDKFAIEYYNKIKFLSKEEAKALKIKLNIIRTNQAKIDALQKLANELDRDIVKEVDSIKNELLNRSILEKELEQAKLLAEQVKDNVVDKEFIDNLIKSLTEQLEACNKAIERVEKSKQAIYRQQEEITQLVNLIKESLEKENFSIRQFLDTLESGFIDNIDRVMGLSLVEDLETLANMTDYNEALSNLETLKSSVQDRINVLTKKIDFLEALKTKSISYKNLIVGTKQANMPNWFTEKWKVFYPVSGNNIENLLKDPKKFARFQYGINKYAERNNITPNQAYDRFMQDYYKVQQELEIQANYAEQQSIDNEILIIKQDLDLLNRQLRAIDNVTEFKRQESFVDNLKATIDKISIDYAIALNRALRAIKIPLSQESDPKFSQDNPPTQQASANLHKGALSSNLYYTTNKVVEYLPGSKTFQTLYDDEGKPILNSNDDSRRWNSFLEMNPDIKDPYKRAKYTLQAFHYKTDDQMPDDLKKAVKNALKGNETDNTIVVAMVSTENGSFIKADVNGKLDGDGGYVFTFLPESDNLFAGTLKKDGSIDKINMTGLLDFYKKHSGHKEVIPYSAITNTKHDPLFKLSWKKPENRVPLFEIREEIVNFAINKHKESISKIINDLQEGEVYLPIESVTNGILLTTNNKDAEGNKINNYVPVRNVLRYKRGIDVSTEKGLDKVTVTVVTKSIQTLNGSNVIVKNAKIGSVIVYNKETKEYFYATQRFVNSDEIDLILHIIQKYGGNKDEALQDLFVNINNSKTNEYYYDKKQGSKLPVFMSSNRLSLMNNIIYWGVPKNATKSGKGKLNKNNIYIQGGKVHFPNIDNNNIFTSVNIADLGRDTAERRRLIAFLATKRINVPTSMLQTAAGRGGIYYKPYLNKATNEISWEQIEGGYLSYLFNGGKASDPILTTNAISEPLQTADSKTKSEDILFASKNVILKTDENGLIKTKNTFVADQPLAKTEKKTYKGKRTASKDKTTKTSNQAAETTTEEAKEQQENCKTGGGKKSNSKESTGKKRTAGEMTEEEMEAYAKDMAQGMAHFGFKSKKTTTSTDINDDILAPAPESTKLNKKPRTKN